MKLRLFSLSILCASCSAVGPDYEVPEMPVPVEFVGSDAEELYTGLPEVHPARWWESLGDPRLVALVDRGLEANLDLRVAYERVREAHARRAQSTGEQLPALSGSGGYTRVRAGENSFPPLADAMTFDQYSLGLGASWELDVWGRIGRLVEAADANLQARVEDARHVRVLVAAEIARQYVDVRTFQGRLEVTRGNIASQEHSLEIATERFQEGLSPALDVAQAQTNLASTEAEVPSLELGLRAAMFRLAVLLGENPGELIAELESTAPIPEPPSTVGVGLPADLLRQRPDVRAAERDLAAQVARIGVATADYYPSFQLSGSIGLESLDSGDLFSSGSGVLGLGPSFGWNIFSGGRVSANVHAQRALADAAALSYHSAVLLALEEVEFFLVAHTRQRERRAALERAATAARKTVELARELYAAGQTDFQNVLDAERSLFSVEDRLLTSHGEVALSFVSLQRALGGGWQTTND